MHDPGLCHPNTYDNWTQFGLCRCADVTFFLWGCGPTIVDVREGPHEYWVQFLLYSMKPWHDMPYIYLRKSVMSARFFLFGGGAHSQHPLYHPRLSPSYWSTCLGESPPLDEPCITHTPYCHFHVKSGATCMTTLLPSPTSTKLNSFPVQPSLSYTNAIHLRYNMPPL